MVHRLRDAHEDNVQKIEDAARAAQASVQAAHDANMKEIADTTAKLTNAHDETRDRTLALMNSAEERFSAAMTAAIAAERRDREERAAAYEREVLTVAASFLRMTQREQADFMEHMWKNVFFRYVCVKGGMESALGINDEVGREETFAAFKSVFPKHETTRFLTQTAPEISAQLRELASIVLGIRVFNRRMEELSRGGNGPSPSGSVPDPAPGYLNLGAKMREDLAGRAHSAARLCAQYRCVSSHQALRRDPGDELLARLADENNNRVAYWSIIRALIDKFRKCSFPIRESSGIKYFQGSDFGKRLRLIQSRNVGNRPTRRRIKLTVSILIINKHFC